MPISSAGKWILTHAQKCVKTTLSFWQQLRHIPQEVESLIASLPLSVCLGGVVPKTLGEQ